MSLPKKPKDSLEQIVADAIERERIINEQHPERNGYGMIQGEADDLIHRIEHLEHNQLRAQTVKVRNRTDRVRVIGSNRLYTHSPEEIVIEKIYKERIQEAENNVLKRLSDKDREIYFLRDIGLYHKDIAKITNLCRSSITKKLIHANKELRKELLSILNGDLDGQ